MSARPFLSALVAASIAAVVLAPQSAITARAAAPMARVQAPGWYRILLGTIEVTVISDGTTPQAMERLLHNTTPDEVRRLAARNFETLPLETSINAFLINTGEKLILVDTGAGDLFGPKSGGRLFTNVRAAGYSPEQIDAVLLTHIHGDHSGGLVVGGRTMFPNAVVYAARAEKDYWFSDEAKARAPEHQKHSFREGRASVGPYLAAGRFRTFEGPTSLFSGVRAIPIPGHTPGHTAYAIESGGQKLLLIGDTVHAGAIQLPKPAVTIAYDADEPAAAARRLALFDQAAREGFLIGAAHLPFPGLGHIRAEPPAYAFVPSVYTAGH